MGYLTHRFSNLTSLVFLLMLSLGTLFMFHLASKVQDTADSWYAYSDSVMTNQSISQHTASVKPHK